MDTYYEKFKPKSKFLKIVEELGLSDTEVTDSSDNDPKIKKAKEDVARATKDAARAKLKAVQAVQNVNQSEVKKLQDIANGRPTS